MYATASENENLPSLIAIGGPTCSGKSTLTAAISDALRPGVCTVMPMDAYYRDLAHLSFDERARTNFDHPDALDWELLLTHVDSLMHRKAILIPVYDFTMHARTSDVVASGPGEVIIVEGLHALHHPAIRENADLRIFLNADEPTVRERRVGRDVALRGRTEEYALHQLESTVGPMAQQFVMPHKAGADLRLDGTAPLPALVQFVLEWLPDSVRR